MSFNLTLFDNSLMEKHAVSEIMLCNKKTERYSLVLTEEQAVELVETRSISLNNYGRIEFGGGVIQKIIIMFSDTSYISNYDYAEFLNELIEIFYYFKNETLDLMSDDDLINHMKKYFEGVCQGSLDQLKYRELERMARNVRQGIDPDHNERNEINELKEILKKEDENE